MTKEEEDVKEVVNWYEHNLMKERSYLPLIDKRPQWERETGFDPNGKDPYGQLLNSYRRG